jgi:hypothetical protein
MGIGKKLENRNKKGWPAFFLKTGSPFFIHNMTG